MGNYYHPSSKKPLFIPSGNHYRKLKLEAMQRSTDCGKPNPNRYIFITASVAMAHRTSKSQCTKRSSVKQSLLEIANGSVSRHFNVKGGFYGVLPLDI